MERDIKQKTNKKAKGNRWTAYMIGVLFIIGIGIVINYEKIGDKVELLRRGYFSEPSFIQEYLVSPSYGLYYRMQEIVEEKDLLPQDVYIKKTGALNGRMPASEFNALVEEWLRRFIVEYSEFDYYVQDHESGKYSTNIENKETPFKQDGWENKYRFYIVMRYDAEGRLEVEVTNIEDKDGLKQQIEEVQLGQAYAYTDVSVPMEPIRDTTFFYGLKKEFVAYSSLTEELAHYNMYKYNQLVYKLMGIPAVISILLACVCPYEQIKKMRWVKIIMRIPVELWCAILAYILIVQIGNAPYIIQSYLNKEWLIFYGIYIDPDVISKGSSYVINILAWLIAYGSIWLTTWMIKSMYHEGIKESFVHRSVIGRLYSAMDARNIRQVEFIRTINLKEINREILFKKTLQHGWLLVGFCCLWFFGIIGVIFYMVGSYKLLGRVMEAIQKDYEKLLEKTSSLAEGKLETELLNQDMGMFDPLKEHIAKIQLDFRQSIEEEVRSQKMKTDLITNVSHDLKTPLTSIISYVDLLKQETISEEKRMQYIDTLERKANRLQVLIEDLFEMSKASSGNIQMHKEKVELISLMKQTLFELEDKIEGADITFRTQFPEHKVYLELDSVRTFRLFDNLINNITKYAMPRSRAYIEVQDRETSVLITLKNVAREELDFDPEQITERFIRGDKSRHTEGSGLGLAIAKSFVELQGGKLEIEIDGDLFKVSVVFDKIKSTENTD